MAIVSWVSVAYMVAAYIAYRLIANFLDERKFQRFAKHHSCEPAPTNAASFFEALSRIYRIMRIRKTGEDILDDIFAEDLSKLPTTRKKMFDGGEVIMTIEPANIQAILATQFEDFETGPRRAAQLWPLLGRSIFSSDGAFWEHSRALFRPQFSRDNINDLESTSKACDQLIHALGAPDADGWTPGGKMMDLLFNFTLDTATDFLFGESVGAQADAISRMNDPNTSHTTKQQKPTTGTQPALSSREFSQHFDTCTKYMIKRVRLQSFYFLGDSLAFRRSVRIAQDFTMQFARRAVNPAQKAHPASPSPEKAQQNKLGLLDRLATHTASPHELRDQTLAILFAGRDTTASLLGWCITRLALHPDLFASLRATILRDFPTSEPRALDFSALKACRPLQHFISEVLRLHPTVPLNNRQARRTTTLPTGGGPSGKSPVAVRKGQVVIYSVYFLHRRADLWGPDALEFRPERWEQKGRKVPAWQFVPFNGGPRICLGQQFALVEAGFCLVRLLRAFDCVEALDLGEARKFGKEMGLTMWPKDGVAVRFHQAVQEV